MSGPKVIRIVTRDELIAVCEGFLARADAALEEWIKVGRRNGTVSDSEVLTAQARIDDLRRLLVKDRFADLQKQVPSEIRFLRDDQQARLSKAAEEQAKARSSLRRQAEAAESLLAALRRGGIHIEPSLERDLQLAAEGHSDSAGVIAKGFALLSRSGDANQGSRFKLAQRLKDGTESHTFANWLASSTQSSAHPAIVRVEGVLAELSRMDCPEELTSLKKRLDAAIGEPSAQHQEILFDSLELDIRVALDAGRRRMNLATDVRLAVAELRQVGAPVFDSLIVLGERASSVQELGEFLDLAKAALKVERDRHAAAARRAAVLKGLASLGYEVTEGLGTAWVEQGKLVLRKPTWPGYGVELVGNPQTDRLQIRAVAFTGTSQDADTARDKDAETLWCGDVSALRGLMAAAGGHLEIERALPIGATPLKRVADPLSADRDTEREGRSDRMRTLR